MMVEMRWRVTWRRTTVPHLASTPRIALRTWLDTILTWSTLLLTGRSDYHNMMHIVVNTIDNRFIAGEQGAFHMCQSMGACRPVPKM